MAGRTTLESLRGSSLQSPCVCACGIVRCSDVLLQASSDELITWAHAPFAAVQVVLFDVQQRTVTAELTVPFVKYVVWSADMEHVGLLSKHAIVIADKKLSNACTGTLLRSFVSHHADSVQIETLHCTAHSRALHVLGSYCDPA